MVALKELMIGTDEISITTHTIGGGHTRQLLSQKSIRK